MSTDTDFIPFSRPAIGTEEERAVLDVMRSGWLTTGKSALAFESEFADYVRNGVVDTALQALAVNSATSGLLLAYDAVGVDANSVVVTTPYTFASTALSAEHLGARIVYADVEASSYSIDPATVAQRLGEAASAGIRVAAVVPVHVAGAVCNMAALGDVVRAASVKQGSKISVVEDAAHAFPSPTAAGFAGTLGDVGVYSFYATKTITTGEGGMVVTRDADIAARMSVMRMHGIDRPVWNRYTSASSWEYDVTAPGWKCNLPDILAAIGREQLKKARRFFDERRHIADLYNAAFSDCDFLHLPPDGEGNAWHLYLLRIAADKLTISRNEFSSALQERGIGVSMHFIPHFQMSYFRGKYGLKAADFPHAAAHAASTLTLPLWPGMTEEQVARVIDAVTGIGKAHYGKS